jgi:hypothetical protein
MTPKKELERVRRICILTSGLTEGVHCFKIELSRCWITDSVTFNVKFSNDEPAGITIEDGEILLQPQRFMTFCEECPADYCSAKCRAAHEKIVAILGFYKDDDNLKRLLFRYIYEFLLKNRRKMNPICFRDTWGMAKELLKRDSVANFACRRNALKAIVLDVDKLSVGTNNLNVVFKRGRVLDCAVFEFQTMNIACVDGYVHKERLLRLVYKSVCAKFCSHFCKMMHTQLESRRVKMMSKDNIETDLKELLQLLTEHRYIMSVQCFDVTMKNVKDVLDNLKIRSSTDI